MALKIVYKITPWIHSLMSWVYNTHMSKNYFIYCLCLFLSMFVYFGYRAYKFIHVDYVPNMTDVRLYENTPVWKLAKAVNDENIEDIKYYVNKNPGWINYQEPKYNATLVFWSVANEKYNSLKALLELGADPNIRAQYGGSQTPLYMASCYSSVDNEFKQDPKYISLLLKYHADPNQPYLGGDKYENSTEIGTSPLMHSIGCGLEKVKTLIAGGADINYRTKNNQSALTEAISHVGRNGGYDDLIVSQYLVVEKKINVNTYYSSYFDVQDPNAVKKHFLVDLLRTWIFPLDSEEYKIKMEIVKEFKRQGIDYFKTKIPDSVLQDIQKEYPDSWQEYIEKY